MIYRNWSLFSSTIVISGSIGAADLAGVFLFGDKNDLFLLHRDEGFLSVAGQLARRRF
ncbi:hypothetical protein ZWY2020_049453 [Hordeum vulgare]|nr:hypothetical protein ZWY2020_049453 [Hordeum vulgare]